MRVLVISALLVAFPLAYAQSDVSLMTNAEISEVVRELALRGAETHEEQIKMVWILMQRDLQGDRDAHRYGRPIAYRLRTENDFSPRARFAFGYFRIKEGYATVDPFARKPRIDEGKRNLVESLQLGGRDPDFQFDAGIALSNLPQDANLFREAINTLTLARRGLGPKFDQLSAAQKADWHTAIAEAYVQAGIVEPGREHYTQAAAIAPESPAGRKAVLWLRANGRA